MSTKQKTLAFVGLGVMGFPMAGHLAKAGYKVKVFNRTVSVAQKWIDELGSSSDCSMHESPELAAREADVVLMCVGNDDDVRSVVYGDTGVLGGMKGGAVLVDHTTASQQLALELAGQCVAKEIGFLDAPVSGGQAGAESGALTIMVGGSQKDYQKVSPILNAYAKKIELMGEVGCGQLTKMVNQICIAGILEGLAEGLHFGQQAGLEIEKVVEVISKGAAQSWQMDNRSKTMAEDEYEFGFAVDWMRKDLSIAISTAREIGASLPLASLVDQFYADIQKMGGGRWDTSSLLRRFTKG
jgi:3-hydroxyisobutyrate dehydrogenase-like beta-hydroxyacid dehydrogenase